MTAISIKNFNGIAPRYAKRKLNPSYAQKALNCDLWSNEVRSLRDHLIANTPTKSGTINSIFKLGELYLHWNEDVDVVRAPLSTSDSDRIYYSGHYNAKSTNLALAQDGIGQNYPLSWYRLGLPSPETAITATPDASGSAASDTRFYVYTYVTAWGEEGPPSPASASVTGLVDDIWNLSLMDAAPLNTGVITGAVVAGGVTTFTCSANHTFETGDYTDITGIVGSGDLPGAFNDVGPLQVTRVSPTTFSIALSPSGTYTSNGTWTREADIQVTNMVKRIYRTVLGKFRFVAEIPAAQATYADTIDDTLLGEELTSTDWVSPPADIQGLIELSTGVLAGFKGNTLYLSEPFVPHAFPTAYDKKFSYEIVGIASIGTTIVVTTKGKPYIVTGTDPAFMGSSALDFFQACVSKRSVVSVKNGVMYACPDGIAYVPSAGAPSIISRKWIKEVDWRELNPSSMNAVIYDDRYYAFYENAVDNNGGETMRGAIVFDPSESESTLTELNLHATATYNHLEDDGMFLMVNNNIVNFSKGGSFGTCQWKSKLFITGELTTMQAAQVKFSFDGGINALDKQAAIDAAVLAVDAQGIGVNGAFGGSAVGSFAVGAGPYVAATQAIVGNVNSAVFKLYAGGELKYEKQLTDNRAFRLPGGYNSDEYEIELSGSSVHFHEVTIAETVSDLQVV